MKKNCKLPQRNTFIFYRNFRDILKECPKDLRCDLYDAISDYALDFIEPNFTDGMAKALWLSLKIALDANIKKWRDGHKGGNPNFAKGKKNPYYQDKEAEITTALPQDNPTHNPTITPPQPQKDNHEITTALPQDNLSNKVNKNISNKKKYTNVNSQKEETISSMSFDGANDARHPSEQEERSKVAMVKKACDIDFNKLAEYFNSKLPSNGMPQVRSITPKRKAAILAREKEHGKNAIIQVIDNATESSFLNGDNNIGFVASFDWIFRPNNFLKVLEGNYGRRTTNGQSDNGAAKRIGDATLLVENLLSQ